MYHVVIYQQEFLTEADKSSEPKKPTKCFKFKVVQSWHFIAIYLDQYIFTLTG